MHNIKLISDACNLPDGTYDGLWSAYEIRVLKCGYAGHFGHVATLETEDGCRSLDGMPVTVTVTNGRAVVS